MHTAPSINLPRDERVRELAHTMWEKEGRPEGRAEDHWLHAETLIAIDAAAPVAAKPVNKPAVKRSAKRTA